MGGNSEAIDTDTSQGGHEHGGQENADMQERMYRRFAGMIGTSTAVMLLLMYSTIWTVDHARWSEQRFYMALFMGGAMAIVMLAWMWGMYENSRRNVGILVAGTVFLVGGLFLARSQFFVDDREYMRGMIPHHSIAILTSERAGIDDVRVRELANKIIEAQRIEIEEMDWLIEDIEENGPATTEEEAAERPVPEFEAED